jgi:hypothetical protein
MDEKEVNSFMNGAVDFLGTLFGGVSAAVDVIPQILLGFIVIFLGLVWLFRKAKNG